jgi:hypothetical protein
MAQDRRPAIFTLIQKLVEKQVDRSAKGVERKIANVFGKIERRECQ